ncbi:pterin-4-alpha-carbinolamine dehydratase [Populus alba x Populus x berolinensis]|nr:pterin-4-alpha-carbinolamine dehydratase [Populus alba x Populus x berolinensis]
MGTTATTTTHFPFSLPPPKSYPPHNHHHFKVSILTPTITPTFRLQAMGAGDKLGWRLLDEESGLKLQCLWKLRDFKCGVELVNRIYKATESCGHFPNVHLEQPNQVRAELWTASLGGLSLNDFIVAAKIDEIKTSDLVPKKRVWA